MKLYYDNVWAALYMRDVFGVKFEVKLTRKDVEVILRETPSILKSEPEYICLDNLIPPNSYAHIDIKGKIFLLEQCLGNRKIYVAEESLGVFRMGVCDELRMNPFHATYHVIASGVPVIAFRNGNPFIMPKSEE